MAQSASGQVRLLGISGSARRNGNTDRAVAVAVDHAARLGSVEAEFCGLAASQVNYCQGCVETCHPTYAGRTNTGEGHEPPWTLCRHHDGITDLLGKMVGADIILIASPVYFGGVSALLKTLMDRSTSLVSVATDGRYGSALAGKIGGAVAVGGARHGGQEAVLQQICTYFQLLQVTPVDFSDYGDQCHGIACVAALPGEIEHDDWSIPVIGTPTSSIRQVELYVEKLVARATDRLA